MDFRDVLHMLVDRVPLGQDTIADAEAKAAAHEAVDAHFDGTEKQTEPVEPALVEAAAASYTSSAPDMPTPEHVERPGAGLKAHPGDA